MALFSSAEANASTIVRAEKISSDGVHQYWVFGVTDAEGNYYDWKDETTAEGADDATQKTAIHDFLVASCEKLPAQPVVSASTNSGIVDTTVG